MAKIGEIIAAGAALGPMYAERLLKDVAVGQFARFARPGGVEVKSNHPAFVLGHLALYPRRIMDHLHQPAGPTEYPASYETLFKNGVECQDDPKGTIYPPTTELTERFFASYRAAIEAVKAAPDEVFDEPNPVEGRLRELFPTVGMAINFYLVGHVQVHLGQVSAWRRAMGLPAA